MKAVKAGGCRTKVVSLARLGGTDGGGGGEDVAEDARWLLSGV